MSGAWDVLQLKKDGMAVKLGGLVSAKDSSSYNFFVESRGGVGTLVLQTRRARTIRFGARFAITELPRAITSTV